jgi:hypothetical protein
MAEEKTTALAPQSSSQALAPAPDYIPKTRRGFEDTQQSDLMIPRLALAQALSPQVTDGDPRRIPGLNVGDLFNSVTNQSYGKEVFVQVLRKMPLRAMEFRSIDEGGGVVDPDVPLDDDRLKWGVSGDKKADKPKATLFRDFLAVILPGREIIALSFKSSGIKAAKTLWGLATMANRDCFSIRLRITTSVKLDPKPHQIYKVEQAGWVSKDDFLLGEEMFEAVQTIDATKIHHEPTTDDEIPFEVPPGGAGRGEGAVTDM